VARARRRGARGGAAGGVRAADGDEGGRSLGRQPSAARRRAGAARLAARAAARRADGLARPPPARPRLADRLAAQGRRRRGARRDPPLGGAVGPRGSHAHPGARRAGLNAVALILRKDLRALARTPALLVVLIAYPLAIAALLGLVAAYASSKPRVAF